MALSTAIRQAQVERNTLTNRLRQARAERRLTEIIKVAGIADEYEQVDRAGDLRIEAAFARIYHAAADPHLRELVVDAYQCWQADERHEERVVMGGSQQAVAYMKAGNPLFIEGTFVPDDDGAAA